MRPEPGATTDQELLTRIGAGDLDAVATLYDRHAGTLLGVALRILRERAEAEDIVHDAFVLVGQRATLYVAERGSVSTWLVTLTRNLSIDRRRRRERRGAIDRHVLAYEPPAQAPSEGADPESQVLVAAESLRMRRALSSLPAPQRSMLEMSFFGGLSYPEIAAIEQVPLGTVKSRVARGLVALREALLDDPSEG